MTPTDDPFSSRRPSSTEIEDAEYSVISYGNGTVDADTSPSVAGIVVDRITTFREAAARIPMNEYGLPKYLYRADLIPTELPEMPVEDQIPILNSATIDITYREGFPTFMDGHSMWAQMPYEPDESYDAFKQYVMLVDRYGVRSLEALVGESLLSDLSVDSFGDEVTDTSPSVDSSGQRGTALRGGGGSARSGAGGLGMLSLEELSEFHAYYFWAARCRAYDLFQLVAHRKLRERRILSTTNSHFLQSEKLLGRIYEYFNRVDPETGRPDFVEELTPKVAMDMMEKLVKIQRISVGLAAHGLAAGEMAGEGATPNATVEVAFRQIARQGTDPEAARNSSQGASLEMLLANPDAAALAQELIIKVNKGS
jgi:hypothetical protein